MKSKKPLPPTARPRRRAVVADEASFTVVLEDLRAQFRVFGEALQDLPTRREMHAMRDELRAEIGELRTELRAEIGDVRAEIGEVRAEIGEMRTDIALLKTAVLDLSKRIP